ncbi:hypothetical protein BD410DRAFT_551311 [Rickenella mellea]|uniref:Uncharacterized protein n=1 Tax=Rickenella mellea TaxID=50990 RepID=A0A4Y7PQN6_9AGAM|nr:hypothetical protein BD410DRAFT_551311 [Rickenella mellea]
MPAMITMYVFFHMLKNFRKHLGREFGYGSQSISSLLQDEDGRPIPKYRSIVLATREHLDSPFEVFYLSIYRRKGA